MAEFLIDTDLLIEILLAKQESSDWLKTYEHNSIGISVVGALELLQGSNDKAHQSKLKREIERFEILPITEKDSLCALEIFESHFLSAGIGILDSFVAAQAVNGRLPLFTFNTKHFRAVEGLNAKKPYARK